MSSIFPSSSDTPRSSAEKVVANNLLKILQRHHRQLRHEDDGISLQEKQTLSRTTYQNWGLGIAIGLCTFGALVGLTKRRSGALARYSLPERPSPSFGDLDRVTSKGRTRNTKKSVIPPQSSQSLDSLANGEVMNQAQLMIFGGASIVVATLTSWYFADRDQFHRAVARLPLLPGKSKLCASACPELVRQYRNLLIQGNNSEFLQCPQTVELDSALQLVLNCQQRSQLIADMKTQQGLSCPDEDVQVPEPGVPFNYLGIPTDFNDSERRERLEDDLAYPYDWLRKLVMDQSPAQ